jgi:hypothetical protein
MTTGFIGLTRQTDCDINFKVFSDKAGRLFSYSAAKTPKRGIRPLTSSSSSSKSKGTKDGNDPVLELSRALSLTY